MFIIVFLGSVLVALTLADILVRYDIKQLKLNHEYKLHDAAWQAYHAGVRQGTKTRSAEESKKHLLIRL